MIFSKQQFPKEKPLFYLFIVSCLWFYGCSADETDIMINDNDASSLDTATMDTPPVEDWTEVTSQSEWGKRNGHTSLVFEDKMWVIGGVAFQNGINEFLNDAWSSRDGINWSLMSEDSCIHRGGHSSVVFRDKIWILGGFNEGSLNDVWNSSDGITWNQVTDSASWSPRNSHSSLVFNNKMWVIGGVGAGSNFNDVWSSDDGVTWIQINSEIPWSPRSDHSSVVFDDKIWVTGGRTIDWEYLHDVWFSGDGQSWFLAQKDALWQPRSSHITIVFDNELWLIGGERFVDARLERYNVIWTSSNGRTWEARSTASWSPRRGHSSFTLNSNSIWILGGNDGELKHDVWRLDP